MTTVRTILAMLIAMTAATAWGAPSKLVLTNEFGEQHQNIVGGSGLPLPGSSNIIFMTGATAPVSGGSGTGATLAALGSRYIAQDTGVQYTNTGTKASPTWSASSPGALIETLAAAGAVSTAAGESLVNNGTAGTYAVTLAAPSSQDGQIKIIKLGTATHTVTLAMTNIKGPGYVTLSGTTTLTFTATGDCAIFMAVGGKWLLIGGNAVAS